MAKVEKLVGVFPSSQPPREEGKAACTMPAGRTRRLREERGSRNHEQVQGTRHHVARINDSRPRRRYEARKHFPFFSRPPLSAWHFRLRFLLEEEEDRRIHARSVVNRFQILILSRVNLSSSNRGLLVRFSERICSMKYNRRYYYKMSIRISICSILYIIIYYIYEWVRFLIRYVQGIVDIGKNFL